MPWGAVLGSVAGAVATSALAPSGGGGGGGGGAPSNQYIPTGLSGADTNWQASNNNAFNLANKAYDVGMPAYDESFNRAQGIDWNPYLQSAGQAGNAYGQVAGAAMGQMQGYGQQAQIAQGQQQQLYGAGAQVLDTAMDPQHALYDRTAQQLQDQVRAGQAARGLGNSAAGAGEEDQAMSNFNIDWQNNQLSRQTQGLQADVNANAAGVNQSRLYGADQAAALAAGSAGAGFYGQAGSVPLQAQQTWAGAPGAAAGQLQGGYANLQQGYGNVQNESIPYMNFGNGALQTNWSNQYQVNRDAAAGMGQIGSQIGTALQNNWGNWFGGGSGGGQGPMSGGYVDPSTGASYNNPSAYVPPGYDATGNYGVY